MSVRRSASSSSSSSSTNHFGRDENENENENDNRRPDVVVIDDDDDDDDDGDGDVVVEATPTTSASTASLSQSPSSSSSSALLLLDQWLAHTDVSFHHFDEEEAVAIRQALLTWYRQHRRKLPWRGDPPPWEGSTANFAQKQKEASSTSSTKTTSKKKQQRTMGDYFAASSSSSSSQTPTARESFSDHADSKPKKKKKDSHTKTTLPLASNKTYPVTAYGVWVSEIMLQQTRVDAVVPYWIRWMETFPTVQALAEATPEAVNAQWAGLGFYRRARLLHQAAKYVVDHCPNQQIPSKIPELLALPGIGKYTAHAVASIAFQEPVPVVDGNVCRVLSRLKAIANHVKAPVLKDQYAWDLAAQLFATPSSSSSSATATTNSSSGILDFSPGDLNQALMELGATYCAPSGTGVDPQDPLREYYYSTRLARQVAALPYDDPRRRRGRLLPPPTLEIIPSSSTTADKESSCSARQRRKTTPRNKRGQRQQQITTSCPLCTAANMAQATELLQTHIWDDNASLLATLDKKKQNSQDEDHSKDLLIASQGHKCFPLPPPKPSRREEVLAVAVLFRQQQEEEQENGPSLSTGSRKTRRNGSNRTPSKTSNNKESLTTAWFMVQRPAKGLLAGQWEFPAALVWSSVNGTSATKNKKRKSTSSEATPVPFVDLEQRRQALDEVLSEFQRDDGNKSTAGKSVLGMHKHRRVALQEPTEHIFSHVRHTMWIEYCQVKSERGDGKSDIMDKVVASSNRKARWMTANDLQSVGVTAGVQKVLDQVKRAQSSGANQQTKKLRKKLDDS